MTGADRIRLAAATAVVGVCVAMIAAKPNQTLRRDPQATPTTCCYNVYTGCQPSTGPCSISCPCPTPTPTPTPTPNPYPGQTTGILDWIPYGTNYVESPWAAFVDGRVWIGGHAGWCCEDYHPDDGHRTHDIFWAVEFYGEPGHGYFRARQLPDATANDDHETGGYCPLVLDGRWVFFGSRTERSYWGQGNRLRPFIVETADPVFSDLVVDRVPLFYPIETGCREMGGPTGPPCGGIGASQHSSYLVTEGGRILTLGIDDVGRMNPIIFPLSGYVVREVDLTTHSAEYLYPADFGPGFGTLTGRPLFPSVSDWALGGDGRIYAYGGNTHGGEWLRSTGVVEWVSDDEGRTFRRTGREWSAPAGNALWDIGVMRDGLGRVAEPLTLVGVTAPFGDYATANTWRLWWWTANRSAMPVELVGRPIRRRLGSK